VLKSLCEAEQEDVLIFLAIHDAANRKKQERKDKKEKCKKEFSLLESLL
jgi:hypothetical protein